MTLDDRRTVFFCPGVVDVPESIANHWALAIHGRRVDPAPEAAAESIEPNSDDTEDDEAIAAADEAERKAHDAAAGDAEREAHTAKLAAIARKAANRSGKGR
jgi:ferric-dicitrate binding protein FerR (iron transport regulator)